MIWSSTNFLNDLLLRWLRKNRDILMFSNKNKNTNKISHVSLKILHLHVRVTGSRVHNLHYLHIYLSHQYLQNRLSKGNIPTVSEHVSGSVLFNLITACLLSVTHNYLPFSSLLASFSDATQTTVNWQNSSQIRILLQRLNFPFSSFWSNYIKEIKIMTSHSLTMVWTHFLHRNMKHKTLQLLSDLPNDC